jgi:hypothetical protein
VQLLEMVSQAAQPQKQAGMMSVGDDGARFVALAEWEDGIQNAAQRIEHGNEPAGETS